MRVALNNSKLTNTWPSDYITKNTKVSMLKMLQCNTTLKIDLKNTVTIAIMTYIIVHNIAHM